MLAKLYTAGSLSDARCRIGEIQQWEEAVRVGEVGGGGAGPIGFLYLVMPAVEGESLQGTVFARPRDYPVGRAARIRNPDPPGGEGW